MKIAIIYKDNQTSRDCAEYIKSSSGFDCVDLALAPEEIDLIVAIGGDGTTLKSVPYALRYNTPIVSVNTGNVGFLSAYSKDEIDQFILDLKSNKLEYQDRIVLEVSFNGNNHYALNEVLIERDHSSCQIATFSFAINAEESMVYSADGYLVATPTGSTAYSYSAGSSIIHPDSEVCIATAVCPRNRGANSIVFPSNKKVKITVKSSQFPCGVFIDGIKCGELIVNEAVTIKALLKKIKIVKTQNFLALLNKKIN